MEPRHARLAPEVVTALKEWRLGCPIGSLDLVFPTQRGTVENLSSIIYALKPIQKAAGIKKAYGLHAFRHFAASLWIEQNFTPKRIQTWLGHSSIQMTYNVYGHLLTSADDDAAAMKQVQTRLLG